MQPYRYTGPIDHTVPVDFSLLSGKRVLITGGANGMGEAVVRKFVAHGAIVTFGDINVERGRCIEHELNQRYDGKATFVPCNITSWEDQVRMFQVAQDVEVVIANAGISRSSTDSLWKLDDPSGRPIQPELNIVTTNITGTLYTFKLAVHYFRKSPLPQAVDRCFVINGSMVAWIDSPANWEYTISKYGLRGLMRTARRSSWQQDLRINYVAPCYIRSAIRTEEQEKRLIDQGIRFGESEDVVRCMARIVTDGSINGRSLMVVPREEAKEGYLDSDLEDFRDDGYLKHMQEAQLRVVQDRWVDAPHH